MSSNNYSLVLKVSDKYYVYPNLGASNEYNLDDFVAHLPSAICNSEEEAMNAAGREYTEYGVEFLDYENELDKMDEFEGYTDQLDISKPFIFDEGETNYDLI